MVRRGDRVLHERWGPGTLIATQFPSWARVRFDITPNLPRTVARHELHALGDPPPERRENPSRQKSKRARPSLYPLTSEGASSVTVAPTTDRTSGLRQEDAWQLLEALRLGVVPVHGIREYTVAREEEIASIERLLDDRRGCRIVWGEYGAGKTHLLDFAEERAIESGFATARLTLDPRENALHHPLRLWSRIASTVRAPGSPIRGCEAIFDRLVGSREHTEPRGKRASRFFSPYLWMMEQGTEVDRGWLRDYVRGDSIDATQINAILSFYGWRGSNVLKMSDFRTYGRMYAHLVGTLACWSADAGCRGLVLLFDEVERVDVATTEDFRFALEVLKHFAAVCLPTAELGFDPESLYRGGHAVHQALPLRFREDQPLSLVFALTPLEEIEDAVASITSTETVDIWLRPIGKGVSEELAARIAAIYSRAHPAYRASARVVHHIARSVADLLEDDPAALRPAVRAAVFLLDADRLRRADDR